MALVVGFHFGVGDELAPKGRSHALPHSRAFVIGQAIDSGPARLNLSGHSRQFVLIFLRPGRHPLKQFFGISVHTQPSSKFLGCCHMPCFNARHDGDEALRNRTAGGAAPGDMQSSASAGDRGRRFRVAQLITGLPNIHGRL
jgi:hypothetical protein